MVLQLMSETLEWRDRGKLRENTIEILMCLLPEAKEQNRNRQSRCRVENSSVCSLV